MLVDFLYDESQQQEGIVRTQLYGRPVVLFAPNTPGTDNNKDYDDQRTPSSNTNQYLTYILIAGAGSFALFYIYNNSNRRY